MCFEIVRWEMVLKKAFCFCLLAVVSVLLGVCCVWQPAIGACHENSNCWMSFLDDDRALTGLSIPGTHDTLALYDFLIGETAACQVMNLADQLDAGVRYIDVRVSKHGDGTLGIYHGIKYMHVNLDDVIAICREFLLRNPSEFVIMKIRQEVFQGHGSGEVFADDIDRMIDSDPGIWYLGSALPSRLKDVRGRILLFREYAGDTAGSRGFLIYGGSNSDVLIASGAAAVGSDERAKTVEEKWRIVLDYIRGREAATDDGRMFKHEASAYNERIFGLPNIGDVASYVNPRISSEMKRLAGSGIPLGILACDKMTRDLAYDIYSVNGGLE